MTCLVGHVRDMGQCVILSLPLTGFLINISVLITLLNYETRQDSLYVYFIFSGLWGMADAVWQTQINGELSSSLQSNRLLDRL